MTPAVAEVELLEIDANNFSDRSHIIDNVWTPLRPGEQMAYEGWTVDDAGEKVKHLYVATVTDLTKMVAGIRVLVLLEEDFQDDTLIEQEIAFRAQDKDGNVWHVGELTEAFDGEELIGAKLWYAGVPEGAKAGIKLVADPKVGDPELSQGYAPPPVSWTDSGQVTEAGLTVTVPAGEFSDVIAIDEHDQETEEGVFQTKYYAPNVGLVKIGFKGDDPNKEELFLTEVIELDETGMERARELALEIDGRGFGYAATTPAQRTED